MNDVGMGILLPATRRGVLEQVARAALPVDRIQQEIERLSGFAREARAIDVGHQFAWILLSAAALWVCFRARERAWLRSLS